MNAVKRHGRKVLGTMSIMSAAGPAVAQTDLPLPIPGLESAPWWAVMVAPLITYLGGLGGRAFLRGGAAWLRAIANGKGPIHALADAADAIEGAPQLPPKAE